MKLPPRCLLRHHRRHLIEPRADMIDEGERRGLRHPGHAQRIKSAGTLDIDRIPDEAADMRDLGDVGQRQMLVDAPPWRQPEIDIGGRHADRVGAHGGGKEQARKVEMKERPQPARAHGDGGGGRVSQASLLLRAVILRWPPTGPARSGRPDDKLRGPRRMHGQPKSDFPISGHHLSKSATADLAGVALRGSLRSHLEVTEGPCYAALRAASAMAIIADPPNNILIPTSKPSAQVADSGRPAKMMPARMRSTMPLASIQPQRPDNRARCSNANISVAMPSTMKNAISTSVSETVPLIGQRISTMPAAMPTTADRRDHQKPGALRIQNVVTRPTAPLSRNSQPIRSVNANVAMTGRMIAAAPRSMRTIPSIRNKTQCSRIALTTARRMSLPDCG